jgi:hypothetical protein
LPVFATLLQRIKIDIGHINENSSILNCDIFIEENVFKVVLLVSEISFLSLGPT